MRPKRTGFAFMEGMMDGSVPQSEMRSGRDAPGWKPYKLWQGDLYECPDCHAQTIVGVAPAPLSEHYEPYFTLQAAANGATLLVKDC